MHAIVTGSTGFLGQHLVAYLIHKGWQVTAWGRNTEIGQQLAKHADFKCVDLTNPASFPENANHAEIIFHCAALSSNWGSYQDFYRANVIATQNLLTFAQRFSIKKFIHVSTPSIYFDYQDKFLITESTALPQKFVNHYATTKYLAEQVLLANTHVMNTIILRPRGIFGEGDSTIMPRIFKLIHKGYFPFINNGSAIIDITYVKNVAHALYLAAITNGLDKKIYNITNDEPLSVKTLINYCLNSLNINIKYLSVPYKATDFLVRLLETTSRLCHTSEPKMTRYTFNLLAKNQTLNITAAKSDLNYQPIISINEGITRYAKWYQQPYSIL